MKWKILIVILAAIVFLGSNWKKTPFDMTVGLKASNVLIGQYGGYGPVTVLWKQVSGPATAIIDSAMRLKTKVSELNYPGRYEFELKITSKLNGHSDSDTVGINVKPPLADQLAYNGKLVIVSRVNANAEIKIQKRIFWIWYQTYLNTKRDIHIGINYVDVPLQSGSFTATVKYGGITYSIKFSK